MEERNKKKIDKGGQVKEEVVFIFNRTKNKRWNSKIRFN